MKPLVLLDAAPFCYGPVSTLLAVVDHLLEADVELVLLASGTAAEFAAGYDPRCTIVPCNTEDEEDLVRHVELFRRCSVFVSNTNPLSVRFAAAQGCRTVYIDTLFWMWDAVDPEVAAADLYLAQQFDGTDRNFARLGADIRRFEVVGPLVAPPAARAPRGPGCLVSFGGMESSLTMPGVTNRYPWVMTRLLLRAFREADVPGLYLFAGRGPVMDQLQAEWAGANARFAFLPRRAFFDELARCGRYLLSPGLTGAYEALGVPVPRFLLLPQNYSQQLQAHTFLRKTDAPFAGWTWTDMYPELQFTHYMPEPEGVAKVNDAILRFETDAAAQERYVALLVEALRATPTTDAVDAGEPGCQRAADRILQLAAGAPAAA
jgi:hypothetical protein